MILEYKNFIEQSNSNIFIQVINGPYWDFILNEEYNDFKVYHITKFHIIDTTNDQRNRLKRIENIVETRLIEINPFVGTYHDEISGEIKTVSFEIEILEHWYEKFIRYDIEGDPYINPDPLEGIDNIYNNRDEFAKLIEARSGNRPPQILDGNRVMIVCKKYPIYSEIAFFNMVPNSNPKQYHIILQTSMKGKRYLDDKIDRYVNACS